MCGLNGIYAFNHSANVPDRAELLATRDQMANRGPDGLGEWWSDDRRLGLGHRRLSILDLSERASQPMVSACGRYVIVFNGEIYNYPALRRDLEAQGRIFRTTSDTEVLLHLYALKGKQMVHDLRGMFAFAVWDNEGRSLFLARDPYGIKPLYTANDGWTFRFASQVKALLAGGHISRDPEPAGIVGFHLLGSVPEPFTLYRDIRQLPAGHTQWVDEAGPRTPELYCSIAAVLADGAKQPVAASEVDEHVRAALQDSVRAHLLADVEVGLFLSRGIDSGALLGLMKDVGQHKIRTFTLRFDEFSSSLDDEGPIARTVANLYGSEHVERVVGQEEFRADFPAIFEAMDQPTIDGINTWFVAKAAREQGLKVALSGVGGDELFAGYASFRDIPRAVGLLSLPAAVPGLGYIWERALSLLKLGQERPKLKGLLHYGGSYPGAYLLSRGLFMPSELEDFLDPGLVKTGLRRLGILDQLQSSMTPSPASPMSRVAALESANYMRNQLLRDADWAGMAHGVEVRTPLVDIRLLRAISGHLPRTQTGGVKRQLADAPMLALPSSVTKAKKLGFSIPMGKWVMDEGEAVPASRGQTSREWARKVYENFQQPLPPAAGPANLASQPLPAEPLAMQPT